MNIERVKKLEKFLKEDPDDPFIIYALAIEWINSDLMKSKTYFDELLSKHPSYVGTYYHAARVYLALDNKSRAMEIYEGGITIATKANNNHALAELQTAYNQILYDED